MKRLLFLFIFLCPMFATAQPVSWNARGIGGGGALFAPSINPANANEYYIACDMSELFHTTDFGQSYTQVHFSEFIGGHNAKVCYTATPGLLYAISYRNDIGIPVKSMDNGISWSPLAGNPDATEDIYTMAVDYAHPSRILLSSFGQIYYSADAGTTFTVIHTALDNGAGNVVGGAFFDNNNIYIGTNDGILVSDDAGGSWNIAVITGMPANERVWSFCAGKQNGITRFFCLTADVNDIYVGLQASDYWGFYRNVYTCDYPANSWTVASSGIVPNTDFPMFIDMAGNDIHTVYVAGSNTASEPNIMKSVNAGNSWARVFLTDNNENISTGWSGQGGDRGWGYGECPFGFAVDDADPDVVIFGDYGFVHKTDDGGASWQQAYIDTSGQHPTHANTPQGAVYKSIGLENTTCWQVDWIDASHMWACYSDIRGIRSTDSGNTWSFHYTGQVANSSYRMVRMANGTLLLAVSGIHDIYQSTRLADAQLDAADNNGKLLYSTDNGVTWLTLHSFNHPVFWVATDPNQPNRVYASVIDYENNTGIGGVYRCDNINDLANSVWTLTPAPPRTERHPASLTVLDDGKVIASFSGRRDPSFTPSSGVFLYDPITNTWTDVSDPGMYYWTKDVVIDPNDATQSTWYAGVFSGWGGAANGLGGLYKTTNRGVTWTRLTGTTLDRVTSCTFHPGNADEIYLTTETQGLWRSTDINAPIPTFSLVTAYPFRQPERVFFNPHNTGEVWVTSFGNGMKVGRMDPVTGIPGCNPVAGIALFPNPASSSCIIQAKANTAFSVYDIQGKTVLTGVLRKGENNIDVHALPDGVYTIRTADGIPGKIVVQR